MYLAEVGFTFVGGISEEGGGSNPPVLAIAAGLRHLGRRRERSLGPYVQKTRTWCREAAHAAAQRSACGPSRQFTRGDTAPPGGYGFDVLRASHLTAPYRTGRISSIDPGVRSANADDSPVRDQHP
jgi:hypothetical protein